MNVGVPSGGNAQVSCIFYDHTIASFCSMAKQVNIGNVLQKVGELKMTR